VNRGLIPAGVSESRERERKNREEEGEGEGGREAAQVRSVAVRVAPSESLSLGRWSESPNPRRPVACEQFDPFFLDPRHFDHFLNPGTLTTSFPARCRSIREMDSESDSRLFPRNRGQTSLARDSESCSCGRPPQACVSSALVKPECAGQTHYQLLAWLAPLQLPPLSWSAECRHPFRICCPVRGTRGGT
jgi:hypothetical protein